MPRWQPDARERLQEAALALYEERGFDETTVADISERAGLTKRTFFRYFADKREVLFFGAERLEELLVTAIEASPPSAPALDTVASALAAVASRLAEQGEVAARRYRIVRATPDLRERQLTKLATLAGALARALQARGVDDSSSTLAAEAGITVLRVASDRWVDTTNSKPLDRLVTETLAQLRTVASSQTTPGAAMPSRGRSATSGPAGPQRPFVGPG